MAIVPHDSHCARPSDLSLVFTLVSFGPLSARDLVTSSPPTLLIFRLQPLLPATHTGSRVFTLASYYFPDSDFFHLLARTPKGLH